MNKHLIILGIAVLLLAVGLSGCEEQEGADTDKFIGIWNAIQFPPFIENTSEVETTWTFYEDSTALIEDVYKGNVSPARWDYEIIGKTLRLTNDYLPFNYSMDYNYKFSTDYNTLSLDYRIYDDFYVFTRIQ